VRPKTSFKTNPSFALSIKSLESFRLRRKYEGKGEKFMTITTVPQTVYEEYDVIYMSQYETLLVGKEWKIWNPFKRGTPKTSKVLPTYAKNVTI